jgi:hypothetical protein
MIRHCAPVPDRDILFRCGGFSRTSLGGLHVARSLPPGKVQGLDA